MTRIAHISDLHLLEDAHEERSGVAYRRLTYLSFLRPKVPDVRRKRAQAALRVARRTGADHLVITGDLTEDGIAPQFEMLATLLDESGWDPARVTLIPGNHDVYTDDAAWDRAFDGPLRAYRATSTLGVPVELRGVTLLPLSTAMTQPYTRSAGLISRAEIDAAAHQAALCRSAEGALVIAMHHSPEPHPVPPMQWIDGLQEHEGIGAVLAAHDHVHVLHGHVHEERDRPVRPGATPRIFSTAAAVMSGGRSVRVYRLENGRLSPEGGAAESALLLATA